MTTPTFSEQSNFSLGETHKKLLYKESRDEKAEEFVLKCGDD
jgi:hypothetical protein